MMSAFMSIEPPKSFTSLRFRISRASSLVWFSVTVEPFFDECQQCLRACCAYIAVDVVAGGHRYQRTVSDCFHNHLCHPDPLTVVIRVSKNDHGSIPENPPPV